MLLQEIFSSVPGLEGRELVAFVLEAGEDFTDQTALDAGGFYHYVSGLGGGGERGGVAGGGGREGWDHEGEGGG